MNRKSGCMQIAKMAVLVAVAGATMLPMSAFAANKFIVKDSSGNIDKFVVTDDAKLGIGTNVPAAGIHLEGPLNQPTRIKALSKGEPGQTASGGGLFMAHNNLTLNNGLPVSGDRLGYVLFGSVDPAGSDRFGAGFEVKAAADWSVSPTLQIPTIFQLKTAGPTGARQPRLTIDVTGFMGIGTQTPTQMLEVNGGVRLNTTTAKPACDNVSGPNNRGTLWFTQGSGVKDALEVCASDGTNYAWRTLY